MPSITRRSVPALALLVVGIALMAGGVFLFPHAGDPTYGHSVEPVAANQVPDRATVTNYSSLSPAGQAAVRGAVESEDGYYAVHDEADKPPEFFYSDYAELGQGIYFVRYEGRIYRLTTTAGGGFGFLAYAIKLVLGSVGLVAALVGGASLYWERARPALAVWGGAGGVLVVGVLQRLLPGPTAGFVQLAPLALVGFVVAAALTYRYAPVDA